MISVLRKISIFNRIFNVDGSEWPKIALAWVVRLLYRIGFVVGWTIIVGMFVGRHGIASLPYLFIVNAFFTILGSLLYSTLIDRFKKGLLMISTLFISVVILLAALYFFSYSEILFFALLLTAISIFLTQFRILFSAYAEDMFTPLQSERTFPIIEAADTFGGIIAGLLITLLSNKIPTTNFVFLWIGLLLAIIPFILFYSFLRDEVPIIGRRSKKTGNLDSSNVISKLSSAIKHSPHLTFLKGIFYVVLLQWLLFNLLEFQYTKAVYLNVSNVILEAGSGFEHSFVHDLGKLFMLFSFSALLVQMFIGSRLINALGVVGSMLLHVVVTFFSLFGLVLSFNFTTAVLAKNNFTISSVIHLNAYHSSYYAVKHTMREHFREFLDGIVRPIGAIFGTIILLFLQYFLIGYNLIFAVNIVMLCVTLVFFLVTYELQNKYSSAVLYDLLNSKDKEVRFNAIDVLSQKGHKAVLPAMEKILLNSAESISIRLRLLRAFAELQDGSVIPSIIKCFHSTDPVIRMAAVDTLLAYKRIDQFASQHSACKYDMIKALRSLYKRDAHAAVRRKVLRLFYCLSKTASLEFVIDLLKSDDDLLKDAALYAISDFKDTSLLPHLLPYMASESPDLVVASTVSLSHFDGYEDDVTCTLMTFLNSSKNHEIASGLYLLGELKRNDKKTLCIEYLKSSDLDLRMHSALALAKIGCDESIPVLIDLLFSNKNNDISEKLRLYLLDIDANISQSLNDIMRLLVAKEINKLISESSTNTLDALSSHDLLTLRCLYNLIEEYEEVETIDKCIKLAK